MQKKLFIVELQQDFALATVIFFIRVLDKTIMYFHHVHFFYECFCCNSKFIDMVIITVF